MSKLFEESKIGNLTLRNRIIMAPMGTKSDPDGVFSARTIRYYEERAKGGVGMIITGRVASQDKYELRTHHLLNNFHHVSRLSLLAEKVHIYGAKLCVQIGIAMGRMIYQDPFTPPYSASSIPSYWFPHLICKPYTIEDIKYLVRSVGMSTALAKRAGADAVELHAYGGYLNDQFHCSLWNKRTDEYGGDLYGRLRFTLECIAEMQKTCDKDFPLIIKYTPYHGIPGGTELPEGIEMAKIFEAAGVQALHVDKGCYEVWYDMISTIYEEAAHQLSIAEAIKKAVTIPVIAHGKLDKPQVAEKVLEEGKTDFVALGHQMLTDPHWANKVKTGKTYDIVPCIGCNECLYNSHLGKEYSCAVNPLCLREDDYQVLPANEKKKVLVIGGGPGGMQAAITASQRDFEVELWEKNSSLGGTLLAAGAPSFKQDILRYVDYLKNKLYRSKVTVKLNKEANLNELRKGNFDKVILATGAKPFMPPIRGIDGQNVKDAISVLLGKEKIYKNVVVVGGGLVGCETALHVKESTEKVTIIEMLDDILVTANHNHNNDLKLRKMIADSGIVIVCNAKVISISPGYVEYTQDNATKLVKCDTVVIAAGFKSDDLLSKELEDKIEDISVIGDALSPRKIYDAVHEGFHAARLI